MNRCPRCRQLHEGRGECENCRREKAEKLKQISQNSGLTFGDF